MCITNPSGETDQRPRQAGRPMRLPQTLGAKAWRDAAALRGIPGNRSLRRVFLTHGHYFSDLSDACKTKSAEPPTQDLGIRSHPPSLGACKRMPAPASPERRRERAARTSFGGGLEPRRFYSQLTPLEVGTGIAFTNRLFFQNTRIRVLISALVKWLSNAAKGCAERLRLRPEGLSFS